ncbi:hypothetical protein H0H93_011025, partial [Arthromyces matolae]
MSAIPPEIVAEILHNLADDGSALNDCSVVSSTFYQCARALLLETVVLRYPAEPSLLERRLMTQAAIGQYVRKLKVIICGHTFQPVHPIFITLIERFERFQCVRTLAVEACVDHQLLFELEAHVFAALAPIACSSITLSVNLDLYKHRFLFPDALRLKHLPYFDTVIGSLPSQTPTHAIMKHKLFALSLEGDVDVADVLELLDMPKYYFKLERLRWLTMEMELAERNGDAVRGLLLNMENGLEMLTLDYGTMYGLRTFAWDLRRLKHLKAVGLIFRDTFDDAPFDTVCGVLDNMQFPMNLEKLLLFFVRRENEYEYPLNDDLSLGDTILAQHLESNRGARNIVIDVIYPITGSSDGGSERVPWDFPRMADTGKLTLSHTVGWRRGCDRRSIASTKETVIE